jgi:hypothetical protein
MHLGQVKTANINWMITITGYFIQSNMVNGAYEVWLQYAADNINLGL